VSPSTATQRPHWCGRRAPRRPTVHAAHRARRGSSVALPHRLPPPVPPPSPRRDTATAQAPWRRGATAAAAAAAAAPPTHRAVARQ